MFRHCWAQGIWQMLVRLMCTIEMTKSHDIPVCQSVIIFLLSFSLSLLPIISNHLFHVFPPFLRTHHRICCTHLALTRIWNVLNNISMGVGPKTINIWHINWRLCRCHLRCHAGSGQNYLHHTPTLHHPKIFIRLFCSMGEYVWKGGGGNTTMTNIRIIFHLYWSHIVLLAIK